MKEMIYELSFKERKIRKHWHISLIVLCFFIPIILILLGVYTNSEDLITHAGRALFTRGIWYFILMHCAHKNYGTGALIWSIIMTYLNFGVEIISLDAWDIYGIFSIVTFVLLPGIAYLYFSNKIQKMNYKVQETVEKYKKENHIEREVEYITINPEE